MKLKRPLLHEVVKNIIFPDFKIGDTQVHIINRPSYDYEFDSNGELRIIVGRSNKIIESHQGKIKVYDSTTEYQQMDFIERELKRICDGYDYLILYDILLSDKPTYQINLPRYYNFIYRYNLINKPTKNKTMNNTGNKTVVESIFRGLSEELGFEHARKKLIEVVPSNLSQDATDFLSNLQSEENRMKRDIIFNDKRDAILDKMEEFRKEMEQVKKASNSTFELMDDEFIKLKKEIKKL